MKQGDRVRIKNTAKASTARGRTGIVLFCDARNVEIKFDDPVVSQWFDPDEVEPLG